MSWFHIYIFVVLGATKIFNVSQKQVALNVKMSEYDSVICPKCGAIAFTKEDTPSTKVFK